MKRILTIAALLLAGVYVFAQSDTAGDTLYSSYSAVDDTVEYHAPKRNPIYYFGNPFNDHFAEIKLFAGPYDAGVGIDYTYLPEVWGINASGHIGYANLWLSSGASYRLSKPWSDSDWHLYGNAGICCEDGSFRHIRPTLEAGIRWASPNGLNHFCYSSGTLGAMTNFDGVYFTFGMGLSLGTMLSLILLLI